MPLGEAIVYLKRAVKRRFGNEVTVRFVDVESREAKESGWSKETVLPVILIAGEVFLKGTLSFQKIVQRITQLRTA